MNTIEIIKILESSESNKASVDLLEIYSMISEILYKKHYIKYDEILNDINIELLSTIIIIALLRMSYIHKNKLKNWKFFLKKASEELIKRDLEPNQVLTGLI